MNNLTSAQILELIRKNMLFLNAASFETMEDTDLYAVMKIIDVSYVKKDEIIFRQGDEGDSIMLVLKGKVGAFVEKDIDIEKMLVNTIEENNFFGEMAIIHETTRVATIKALSDSIIGAINKEDFWDYFKLYPIIAKNILWGINLRLKHTHRNLVRKLVEEKNFLKAFNRELDKQVNEQTERLREKDMELLEMDRIVGISTMAAGFAHEINTPLGVIKSSVDTVKKSGFILTEALKSLYNSDEGKTLLGECNKDGRVAFEMDTFHKKFARIERGVEKITNIIQSIKSFANLDMTEKEHLDINKIIDETINMLTLIGAKNIAFVRKYCDSPQIECNASAINQSLFNIISNSVDAVEDEGVIEISTTYDFEKDQIAIEVHDNGHGMPQEILRQVYIPFFTTKPVGSGIGVGLTIAERAVKHHNGQISIVSVEGKSTTVTLTLPVKQK